MTTSNFSIPQSFENQREAVHSLGVYLDQLSSLFAAIERFDEGRTDISSLAALGKFLAGQQYDATDELTEKLDTYIEHFKERKPHVPNS